MEVTKGHLIEVYFTRINKDGKPYLKRKTDGTEIPLVHFSLYNEEQIQQVGRGEFTPEFLSE